MRWGRTTTIASGPAFRYGFESAPATWGGAGTRPSPTCGRAGSGTSTGASAQRWDEIKHAVRDAWDRVVGATQEDARRAIAAAGIEPP